MADLLNTSVSGLIAFQRALDTTSHNIANVGTDGYSRQRVLLATRPAFQRGNGWVGSGVDVTSVQRVYDQQLSQLTRNSSSAFSGFDAFATQAGRVNNLFADQTTGLSATLQNFSNALHDVANSPASIPARQVLLSQATTLTSRLKSYDDQLEQINTSIESQLKSQTDEISTLANSIAQLNARIAAGFGATGQPPNDLLDQRDRLIDQLSQRVDVNTVTQADGQLNVFVGSGQPLVLGANASPLVTIADPYEPTRHGIGLSTSNGAVDITGSITGGTLGGLLDFRAQVLDPVKNSLGQLSVGLAGVLNDQHRDGMDLNGALGGDLFSVGGVQTFNRGSNAGTGNLTVTRTGVGAVTTNDYVLSLTSSGWTLNNVTTGGTVALSGTGTALDPFTADGLSIAVSGTPQVGDTFLIKPTAGATAGLGVLITDPAKIAAAAPIRTSANVSNTGGATISAGSVDDVTNAQLRSTVNIQFNNPPTTYSVNGAGSFAYTTGSPITINGWSVTIAGSPAAGDQFTVSDNTGGTGDNRNALLLANSAGQKALVNGTASLNDAASRIVGTVGIATRQAQASRDAQEVVYNENVSAQQAVSGVNLDEEATNMLKYQQAYQAAAQIIKVADTLFQTLLNSVAR